MTVIKEFTMDELNGLYDKIKDADKRYYSDSNPNITDKQYDELINRVKEIEKQLSVKSKLGVGSSLDNKLSKVDHEFPMLSIDNIFSKEELIKWDNKIKQTIRSNPISSGKDYSKRDPFYWIELKYDGVSLSLIYEGKEGSLKLTRAITRGTGLIGEDVTHNLKYIDNIPLKINVSPYINKLIVRGEVVISKDEFIRLNNSLSRNKLPTYSNPRNTASGIIRSLEVLDEITSLKFIAYGAYSKPPHDNRHDLQTLSLNTCGFTTMSNYSKTINHNDSVEVIMDYYNDINEKRNDIPFDIDGIVIKLNYFEPQDIVGFTSRAPKFFIAFKFESEVFKTTLREVLVQIGRTGILTPVAVFDVVNINGVSVEKATLHNFDLISQKDIRIGDEIFVRRAGDVIPEVTSSITESRIGEEKFVDIPSTCPSCGSEVIKRNDRQYYCTGGYQKCKPQMLGMLEFAVSRNALNIVGLGSAILANLMELNLVKDISDIFELNYDKLSKVNNFKDISILKLLSNIQGSRQTTWDKFIYCLGIPNVGKNTSRLIADKIRTIDDVFRLTKEELISINDIGEIVSDSFISYRNNNEERIRKLYSKLVIMDVVNNGEEFLGINFSITGSFDQPRRMIEDYILNNGGSIVNIGNKTDVLLVGKDPGNQKVTKAKEKNIKVIGFIPRNKNDLKS